jgi:hypothetical protein
MIFNVKIFHVRPLGNIQGGALLQQDKCEEWCLLGCSAVWLL